MVRTARTKIGGTCTTLKDIPISPKWNPTVKAKRKGMGGGGEGSVLVEDVQYRVLKAPIYGWKIGSLQGRSLGAKGSHLSAIVNSSLKLGRRQSLWSPSPCHRPECGPQGVDLANTASNRG